jgi:hypothetical protein
MVRDLAEALKITDDQVFVARREAARWTNEIMSAQLTAPAPSTA